MIRRVIEIDEERCDGCGICASACHEGAIEVIDGKAHLVRDDYCDGLGDCLPGCPQGAISFVEREAAAYDEAAVEENKRQKAMRGDSRMQSGEDGKRRTDDASGGGCPGTSVRSFDRGNASGTIHDGMRGAVSAESGVVELPDAVKAQSAPSASYETGYPQSELQNWPVQLKLAPMKAPYYDGANLLIAADCCAYSFAAFHERFIRNRTCVIGCPKLDGTDYSEKLTEIISHNEIKSVTICRMEVPCCGGLERMATEALKASGKFIPWQVVTFSLDGRILD